MKTILCLIGAATLVLTSGCTSDRGGYYGTTEYQPGTYSGTAEVRTYPDRYSRYDSAGYFDQWGYYHRYNSFPERGQYYNSLGRKY